MITQKKKDLLPILELELIQGLMLRHYQKLLQGNQEVNLELKLIKLILI